MGVVSLIVMMKQFKDSIYQELHSENAEIKEFAYNKLYIKITVLHGTDKNYLP